MNILGFLSESQLKVNGTVFDTRESPTDILKGWTVGDFLRKKT